MLKVLRFLNKISKISFLISNTNVPTYYNNMPV